MIFLTNSIVSQRDCKLLERKAQGLVIPFIYLFIFNVLFYIGVQLDFPCGSAGKESACKAGELGLISRLGKSPGEENGYPPQYSGLENSMDCNHGVAKSPTQLSDMHSQLIGDAVTASCGQQRDSAIHMHYSLSPQTTPQSRLHIAIFKTDKPQGPTVQHKSTNNSAQGYGITPL